MLNISLTAWHWLSIGTVLLLLELSVSGGFLLWMGIAAGIVAVLLFIIPLAFTYQLFIFAVSSVISCIVWWAYLKKHPRTTDQPTLNRRGEQYIGRYFTLTEPIINGRGKIRIGDSVWSVSGQDMPTGTTIKVVGLDNVVLTVVASNVGNEPANNIQAE